MNIANITEEKENEYSGCFGDIRLEKRELV